MRANPTGPQIAKDLALALAQRLLPIVGSKDLATEVANAIALAYGFEDLPPEETFDEVVRITLTHRLRHPKTYRAEHLTEAMVDAAAEAVADLDPDRVVTRNRRTSKRRTSKRQSAPKSNPQPRPDIAIRALLGQRRGRYDGKMTLTAIDDTDERVGFLTMHLETTGYGPLWVIDEVDVLQRERRRGVGTRLYEAAAREAEGNGGRLASDTAITEAAQGFWAKQLRLGRAKRAGRYFVIVEPGVRDLKNNPSAKPHGFPWPKDRWAYHATTALGLVSRHGLKSRKQLDQALHATGGGPDEAVSFTLDVRVARSIALGLRTFARCARGELSLGDLIIAMQRVAPKGTAWKLKDMRLTPEFVANVDRGLYPFATSGYFGTHVSDAGLAKARGEHPNAFVDVKEHFSDPRSTKPYQVVGWAPRDVVIEMQQGLVYAHPPNERLAAGYAFEFFKSALAMGSIPGEAEEVYDPFFFLTSIEGMAPITDEQIGIVRAQLGADWLCAGPRDAQTMGFDTKGLYLGDWAGTCEEALREEYARKSYRAPSRDWEAPDPSDTIVYLGAHMAEVRAYDTALVKDLDAWETMDEILDEARTAWFNKGIEVEDPIAWPYFKPVTPWLAR